MASLNADDLIAIHHVVIEETGGSFGLRDPGMLEAIAAKPDASFGGQELYADLASKAAALYEAVVNYHVFVDGNKRTGVAALGLYLHKNSHDLVATNVELERFTLHVATTHPDLAEVAGWVQQHSRAARPAHTSRSHR